MIQVDKSVCQEQLYSEINFLNPFDQGYGYYYDFSVDVPSRYLF